MRISCYAAATMLALSGCGGSEPPPDALTNLTAEDLMVNQVVPASLDEVTNAQSAAPDTETAERSRPNATREAGIAAATEATSTPKRAVTAESEPEPQPQPEPEPELEAEPEPEADPHAGHDMNNM